MPQNAAQNADKRQHIRIPSSRPVLLIFGKHRIYATMTDFSKHGIGFMSEMATLLHERVEVHFDIPTDYHSGKLRAFQFKAEVKHCLNLHKSNHIGVRLDFPSAEYMAIFDTLTAA